jgi:hypothetical protein
MRIKIFFWCCLFFQTGGLRSQALFYERVFGSTSSDISVSVKQISSGSIYVCGYSMGGIYGGYDVALVKLDRYGNVLWTKYYGTAGNDYGLYLHRNGDNDLIMSTVYETADFTIDIKVIRVDSSGGVIWEKTYGTPVNESCRYIEQTKDKGFILAGFQNDGSGSNDIYVLKLGPEGDKEWEATYGGMDNDYADAVHQLEDGGYIISADTRSKGAGGYDTELLRIDSIGGVKWNETYGDAFQNGCQGLLVTSDKRYLSYGETEIFFGSPYNFILELIDSSGASIWRKTPGGPGADAAFSAVEADDKGFILTGYSNSNSGGAAPNDLVVFKIDSLGNIIWTQYYGGSGVDIGYDIIRSVDNGYLITGKTFYGDDQFYLLSIDRDGLLTGIKTFSRDYNL